MYTSSISPISSLKILFIIL
ncbi:hypothetical protein A2U01_0097584, partial [Trifolium medium]|nr:hypothetical protein [Trifolium medium]